MNDGRPEVLRNRNVMHVELRIGANQRDTTEQARPDIVRMPSTISGGFASDHEREELSTGQRFAEKLVHGKGTADCARGAGTQAAAERHLLMNFHFNTKVGPTQVTQQVQSGDTGSIQLRVER